MSTPPGMFCSDSCAVLLEVRLNATLLSVLKVTFIGAGSVEFTRNVVTDLCGYAELTGELHLALHDVAPSGLGTRRPSSAGSPNRPDPAPR